MDLGFEPVNTPAGSFAVVQFDSANDEARAYVPEGLGGGLATANHGRRLCH